MADIYPLIRPFLFLLGPEQSHSFVISVLKHGLGPKIKVKEKSKSNTRAKDESDSLLNIKICGINFESPLGLAAGFDKQCEVMSEVLAFGFGFTEVGTVTPLPQSGNPKPRIFRIPEARSIINRFGFNSDGMDVCARRIGAWRDEGARHRPGIVGINIGSNKDSTDVAADFVAGVRTFSSHADYLTVNISSPNTPGLRDFQGRDQMTSLLANVIEARNAGIRKPPIFVKIAPDQTEQQEHDIATVALASGVDGIIISNTTTARPSIGASPIAKEAGGFSGPALMEPSTKLLGNIYRLTEGKIPLIGCGGVFTGADAYAKIRAGASLVQLYTALVYEGPGVVARITRDLALLLRRDGFASISEAVGANYR